MPAAKQSWLHKKLKLSHHKHTGRRLPTQHTSRGVLVVLTLAVGFMLIYVIKSYDANAAALVGDGSLGLSGLVKPTSAAEIIQPQNNQVFSAEEISINGSCPTTPPQNIVKIIDNNIVTGVAPCTEDGAFQLKVDLFPGINYVKATVSDIYGHTGPASAVIKLNYSYPYNGNPAASALFNISSQSNSFVAVAGKPYALILMISDGKPPYAVSIDWGDGHNDLLSQSTGTTFTATHVYQTGSEFQININGTDSLGHGAYIQSTVLVSGPTAVAITGSAGKNNGSPYGTSILRKILPAYAAVTAGVLVFWLGEVFEKQRLLRLNKLVLKPRH